MMKEFKGNNLEMYRMSALGRLLEDLMFSSKTLKDCLASFGKDSGSGGVLSFVLLQIPLVGGTIYTALEFYGMGRIVGSDYINQDDKVEAVFKTVTKVTATIGSAVGGGVIGQILIPVPLVGAMIGGLVGGAVGSIFGKAIENITTHEPILFTDLVKQLENARSDMGFWTFDGLGGPVKDVMARWFTLSQVKHLEDDLWLSVIAFVVISFYIQLREKQIKDKEEYATLLPEKDQVELAERKSEVDHLNLFMEVSIVHLAENINLLEYDKRILKINDVMGELIKGKYIDFDVEIDIKK